MLISPFLDNIDNIIMSLKQPQKNAGQKGRSLEEDIERLEDSGLISKKDKKEVPADKDGKVSTKEQQQTGSTERSDRRL
jgi:hypothetical protein